ncbi:MAG TPA: PaaI family thioesterase [Solirubrobacteraceae bacterium]|nr:PaaI family thioesterase [Solirubrobacteraceae bacterium]
MAAPNAEQQVSVAGAAGAFDRLYGLEILELGETVASARVQVRDELKQPMGLIHGGVYASVAESIASIATARAVRAQDEFAVGLANSTSFLRPITEGTIHARAQRLHRGRTTWVWDVTFTDDQGKTCAVTRMTVAVRPQRQSPT